MGRNRYPAPHWKSSNRRLYRSTLWETRCSYINQPQCFSNTQYLLIAITIIWIFRRKTKTQYFKLCTVIKPRKTNNKVELLFLPLIWLIWNGSINILKEIHSRTTSLKLKLLLQCGDVEANPGPYNKGKLTCIQCDVKMESTITTATCKAINVLGEDTFLFFFIIFQLKYNKKNSSILSFSLGF